MKESQGTRQTPGISDVLAFLKRPIQTTAPAARDLVAIECKRHGGKLSPDQERFRAACLAADIKHVVGTLDQVIAWLIAEGYLARENVGHYHQTEANRAAQIR